MEGMRAFAEGRLSREALNRIGDLAVRQTIEQLEATGSPIITDGEQTKPSFATYPVWGLSNVAADGVAIPFADGHVRVLPRLTSGPFHYGIHADEYLRVAQRYAQVPVKQAIISASALSLLYPPAGLTGYSREAFLDDLLREHEADIRRCLQLGACKVQIDFTEGRLALKLDPTGELLRSFVELNNQVLERFSQEERAKIGVHTCPGGDKDSTHSAEVDYAELLPSLFDLNAGSFYLRVIPFLVGNLRGSLVD